MILEPNGRQLVQDEDCHWYLIPVGKKEEFYEWAHWMDIGQGDCPTIDFDYYRMPGGPEGLTVFTFTHL